MIDNGYECEVLNLQGIITYSAQHNIWGFIVNTDSEGKCIHFTFPVLPLPTYQVIFMSFKLLHNTKECKE